MMTSQVLLGVSLFAWLILDVCGLSVKGLQSQHQRSGGTSAGGNTAAIGAGSGSSGPAGVFMQQPRSVQPLFVGVSAMPAAGYATGSVPAGYATGSVPAGYATGSVPAGYATGSVPAGYATGSVPAGYATGSVPAGYATGSVPAEYYSGASYIPGSAAGSPQAAAGQSSLPEAKWTIAPQAFEDASSAQPQGSSSLLPPPVTLQSGETSNVVKEAEPGNYQQQTEEFGYPAGRVGGLWGYSSPYPHQCPFPYPYFDYRLLYGMYPPGTYTTLSRNYEKGKDYYRPGTSRKNMALMLHKWPRTLELASRRSNQMRT